MGIKGGIKTITDLMEISARTAPKALGQDLIEVIVVEDDQRIVIGRDMIKIAGERDLPNFARDGQNRHRF